MTYAGARNTASQMAGVLHFGLPEGRLHTAFNFLDQELTRRGAPESKEDEPLQLNLANAVWAQQGHTFLQDYLDLLAREYGAGLRLADFANQAEPARREINGWVSDQTQGKIPELVPPGLLDAATRLVLVNAIYFKALWANPFNPSATQEARFHRLDGSSISVPFMSQTLSVPYAKGDGWQAVELPTRVGRLPWISSSLTLETFIHSRPRWIPRSWRVS
jgi:serpin B